MTQVLDFQKELELLEIDPNYINILEKVLKNRKKQRELIETLKTDFNKKENRNKVVKKILEKLGEKKQVKAKGKSIAKKAINDNLQKTQIPKKQVLSHYSKIKNRAQKLLDKQHQIKCLKGEPKKRELNDEFDRKKDCIGNANYICHHCGRNLCSQHSYWIPDTNFPYLSKKSEEGEYQKDLERIKKGKSLIFLGIFIAIIGLIFTLVGLVAPGMLVAGIIGFILAGAFIIYGIFLLTREEEFIGTFYPSFIKIRSTKWDHNINETYEHQGFYTAVHCWDCFKKYHTRIYNVAEQIIDKIYEISKGWKRKMGDISVEIDDDLRTKCSLFGANLYLNEFKFGRRCYLPLERDLRIMVRPSIEGGKYQKPNNSLNSYNPTPVWFFKPLKTIKTKRQDFPTINVKTWIARNENDIKRSFSIKRGYI